MRGEDLEQLFEKYLRDELSTEEKSRLARYLESDEQVCRAFVEHVQWSSMITRGVLHVEPADLDEVGVEASEKIDGQPADTSEVPALVPQTLDVDPADAARDAVPPFTSSGPARRRGTNAVRRTGRRERQNWLRLGAFPIAAAVAAVLVLSAVILFNKNPQSRQARRKDTQAKPASQSKPVEVSEAPQLPTTPAAPVPKQALPLEQPSSTVPVASAAAVAGREGAQQPPAIAALPPVPQSAPKARSEETAGAEQRPEALRQSDGTKQPRGAPETERPIAHIAGIDGRVMYARGAKGRWRIALVGIGLLAGDQVDTRTGMAYLKLAGGATMYANRRTVLRILKAQTCAGEEHLVVMGRGRIYVVEGGGKSVHVATADGLFSPVGTRFELHKSVSATILAVDEGAVEVRGRNRGKSQDKPPPITCRGTAKVDLRRPVWNQQPVRVNAGYRARLRGGATPTVSRAAGRVPWWRGLMAREEGVAIPLHDLRGWTLANPGKAWTEEGVLHIEGWKELFYRSEWQDVELRFDLKLSTTQRDSGFNVSMPAIGHHNTERRIRVAFESGGSVDMWAKRKAIGGTRRGAIRYDAWERVRIRVEGTAVTLWINGKTVLEAEAPPGLSPERGGVIFVSKGMSHVAIRNLRFKDLQGK